MDLRETEKNKGLQKHPLFKSLGKYWEESMIVSTYGLIPERWQPESLRIWKPAQTVCRIYFYSVVQQFLLKKM